MHHGAGTGNQQICGSVVTPRCKRRQVSVPDVEGLALIERLGVTQVIADKLDAAIEHGLVKGGQEEWNIKVFDFCAVMLPCLLLADDQVRSSFVNYHLDGECFDILIITRFAVENQTSETRMISDGKCSLIIADKSSEIWRRGARVWCEHINHADQTRDNHIIYPTDSLMKIADISINTRKGLHTVGRFHLDNCIVSGKTARVISVASLFRWFFIEMAGNVMSNKSVAIKCTPTITMYTVEACTTRSRDFVPTS